ncbi:MAG: hypothetical protein Q9227_007045 [Pyrenula ochraceoflavens]
MSRTTVEGVPPAPIVALSISLPPVVHVGADPAHSIAPAGAELSRESQPRGQTTEAVGEVTVLPRDGDFSKGVTAAPAVVVRGLPLLTRGHFHALDLFPAGGDATDPRFFKANFHTSSNLWNDTPFIWVRRRRGG